MDSLLAALNAANPATWLIGSVALAIVVTQTAWLVVRRAAWVESTVAQVSGWLAGALFLLLPPLAAWRAGILSPFFLGVSEINWVASLETGAATALLMCGVLLFGWLTYRRTLPRVARSTPWSASRLIAPLNAALLQWHWAFYRALAIGVLMTPAPHPSLSNLWTALAAQPPLYWGAWLAILAVALEWALNPFARATLRTSGRRETTLRGASLAVATTALFVLTRNFWLCLACHVAVETLIAGWWPLPEPD